MSDTIDGLSDKNTTLEERCLELSNILGLAEPVSKEVLFGAMHDNTYVHNLLASRKEAVFLKHLLANPPQVNETPAGQDEQSNIQLMKKATKAIWDWGKTGFSIVDEHTLERRENACIVCEHLGKPEKALQKLVTSKSNEQIGKRVADCVCKLCGCSISKKIRLPSESCPGQLPGNPELNKWGEPALNRATV